MPDLGICKLKLIFLCEGFDHVEILRIFKRFLKFLQNLTQMSYFQKAENLLKMVALYNKLEKQNTM